MRLIDADDLIRHHCGACANKEFCAEESCPYYEVRRRIETAPTIEPEVRHGWWIPTEYDSYADGSPVWDKYECSESGHEHNGEEDTLTAFCPDCGAQMDGGADNG